MCQTHQTPQEQYDALNITTPEDAIKRLEAGLSTPAEEWKALGITLPDSIANHPAAHYPAPFAKGMQIYDAMQERINQHTERATDKITLSRVGDEIWLEFTEPGLRLRLEMNQTDIDSLATCSRYLAEDLRFHLAAKKQAQENVGDKV